MEAPLSFMSQLPPVLQVGSYKIIGWEGFTHLWTFKLMLVAITDAIGSSGSPRVHFWSS
jgi:hypothetical protein